MGDVLVDITNPDRTDRACGDILGFDFSDMTSEQLETILTEAEAGVARLRLLQTRSAAGRIATADPHRRRVQEPLGVGGVSTRHLYGLCQDAHPSRQVGRGRF